MPNVLPRFFRFTVYTRLFEREGSIIQETNIRTRTETETVTKQKTIHEKIVMKFTPTNFNLSVHSVYKPVGPLGPQPLLLQLLLLQLLLLG